MWITLAYGLLTGFFRGVSGYLDHAKREKFEANWGRFIASTILAGFVWMIVSFITLQSGIEQTTATAFIVNILGTWKATDYFEDIILWLKKKSGT